MLVRVKRYFNCWFFTVWCRRRVTLRRYTERPECTYRSVKLTWSCQLCSSVTNFLHRGLLEMRIFFAFWMLVHGCIKTIPRKGVIIFHQTRFLLDYLRNIPTYFDFSELLHHSNKIQPKFVEFRRRRQLFLLLTSTNSADNLLGFFRILMLNCMIPEVLRQVMVKS